MNSIEIFQLALNLPEPWHVKSIGFDEQKSSGKKTLNIKIGFTRGHQFDSGKIHDTRERSWRHLIFFEHECYIVSVRKLYFFLKRVLRYT